MSEAAPASAPLERHAWLPYAVLVAVGALLYGRTIAFGFTHYDDYQLIVDGQPYIASLRNAPQTFFHDGFAALGAAASGIFYRPLLWISLMIDAQLGGSQPTVYHLTNVVLHLIACCLVYALLVRLALERSLAAFLALVFCVHPALVVGVAPISGRNDTLLAVFVLSAALLLLAFLRSRSFTLLPAVLLAFGACLFTKETGVAFCAVGPLLVWHGRRREEGLSPRLVALTAGVLAVTLAWLLLRRMTLGAFPLFLSKIPENVPMLVVYVGKTLFPVNLSVAPSLVDTALWPGALALVAFAAAGVSMRERLWGLPGVGLVWYFVFLFPALLAHPDTSGLEHRLYVPMVGMLLFLSGLRLPERVRLPQRALRAGAVLLVCGFAALSSAASPC